MSKIALIVSREYKTRIRNKTFILTTILTPLIFIGIMAASIYFSTRNTEQLTIGVYDESGIFKGNLQNGDNISYAYVDKSTADSARNKQETAYKGVLIIPPVTAEAAQAINYFSNKQLGMFTAKQLNDDLNEVLERYKMVQANIDTALLAQIKKNEIRVVQKIDSETVSSEISYGIGYGFGMLTYFIIFVYGSMVMRGVMEEKVNRIAEVMVSSVKPFQLMMGKIIGIGAVALTQFLIWMVLIVVAVMFAGQFLQGDTLAAANGMANNAEMSAAMASAADSGLEMKAVLAQINIPLLVGCFIFYFLGGFLFYASLFAAIGSAVNEDPQDAQSMMLPVTAPIIIAILMMTPAVSNPSGPIAFWGSMIPFTSPVIMMARLPFGVPGAVDYWELALSVILLTGGFLFTTWLSARIYRTGILMYGKKHSWKEMLQWVFLNSSKSKK